MKKQENEKQFRELSDQELEKVTGGERKPTVDVVCHKIQCKIKTLDEYGCPKCI